jgi:hypothetical protein
VGSEMCIRDRYHADFVTQNLDVEAIVPSLDQTVVNGHIAISGTHIITGPREFMSEATLYNSRIFDFPIDTVYLLADLSQDVMQVDSFWIEAQYNKAIGKGSYHFADKSFDAQMQLHSKGLKNFEKYGVPSVNFYRGESDLAVSGDDSEINYEGEVHFYDVNYGQLTCDTLSAIAKGVFTSDSISSEGSVTLRNAEHGDLMMDSIAARFRLLNADIWSSVNFVHSEEIKGEMESDVHLGDTILLQMKRAYLNLPDAHYYLTDTLQKVAYYSDRLKVENLEIKERLDSSFWWRSKGLLGMGAKNDFFLDVNNFHLDQLDRFIDSEDSIKGLLSLQMNLFGDVADLSLSGKYGFENARYGDLLLPDAKGELNYQTDTFTMNTWLTQLDSCVYATISVPVAIVVDTAKQFYWQKPESFDARLMIDSLSVNIPDVPEYSHLKAGANLNGTIQANGELSKPQFFGQIEVSNGHLSNYNRGIFYKEVFGVVGLNGRTIAVDTLYINSDKGYFASKGQILFDTTIVSGDVISSDLNTSIKNFHLVNHRNYDINISGNPYYRVDSSGLPQFGGKLLVNRSSFYIPGLMNNEKKDGQVKDAPLLVMAIQETDSTYERKKAEEDGQEKLLLKKLRGRLTVEIPRSTWIKGENMNIEIGGDFDIAKTGDYFELFGDVEIFRGNYILYGRKFNIEEGVITFMGGEKNDPRLDISAEYVFRGTDREKHSLKLSVTQNLSEPTISFTLDGNAISESDAVSIMVFGKTMDELNYAGQNGIIGSVGSNMLTSIVTSSLNSTIGQRLKLDMIEVNATENWTSAAFVVGKYITNDLFVIYQRGFGETEDDEITPETITLEYELNKLVFIRLQGGSSKSSGFDVILKVESTK